MAQNTGTFFKVNDNDGIPLVGVSTNGKVVIAPLYGYVGIGTTNPREKLDIIGNASISGIITALSFTGSLTGTATTSTNVIGGIASVTSLRVTTGITTLGYATITSANIGIATIGYSTITSANIGIATIGFGTFTNLRVSGITTLGYATITSANIGIATLGELNVGTSGTIITVTVSGLVGIGTTNPTSKLWVDGDGYFTGILTASKVASGIPQNTKTSAYILQKSDVGKYISISSGGVTVPSGFFSEGDVVSVYNNSTSNQTITQGTSVTMYFSGTSATGNRILSQRGLSTILCVGSNTFIIGGAGLS